MKKRITGSESLQVFEEPMVALFKDWWSNYSVGQIAIKDFLMTDRYKNQVECFRNIPKEYTTQRDKSKGKMECITPSSKCNCRRENHFNKYFNESPTSMLHTGLICIDLDAKHNPKIDLPKAKHIIGKSCPDLYYAGLSIGGEGIFLLFRISNPEFHKQHFNALVYYLKEKFNLNVDRAVQNPISLRVASYDEDPYYNPNPTVFKFTMEIENSPMPVVKTESKKQEIRENIKNAISAIKLYRIDITNGYRNWFKIGSALASEFGEEAREWFHEISCMNIDYNKCVCDFEYDKCLKYKQGKVKIATFFYYCKCFGINHKGMKVR